MGFLSKITGADKVAGASKRAGKRAFRQAGIEQQNILGAGQRSWETAQGFMNPYLESGTGALNQLNVEMGLAPGDAGTAYMNTGGYQTMMDEARAGVDQAAASSGGLYSGRRLQSAGAASGKVQQNYYQNYMNMLSNMASSKDAQFMSQLGVNQMTGTQRDASSMMMQGVGAMNQGDIGAAQAKQSGYGDLIGAAATVGGAYMGMPAAIPDTGGAYDPNAWGWL